MNIISDIVKERNYVNKTKFKDGWSFIQYDYLCRHYHNKIKEVSLESLGIMFEKVISRSKKHITFEQYIYKWEREGYKIV